jgi:fructan beta-fructosidase
MLHSTPILPLAALLAAVLATPCLGEGVPRVEFKRELPVSGRYLLIPVANNQKNRSRITVTVDGRLVHRIECDFPSDRNSIDWWTYLEMGDYTGKTATITGNAPAGIPGLFEASDELRDLAPLYDEALRPQLRFSQMRGWNNDPNGMLYHDGEYHFFWQCNPGGWEWANMYWGHAVSKDLIHWSELDRALRPFGGGDANRHPNMARGECFSGSGNVDLLNTSGWQTGKEPPLVLAFTDTGCGESLAYSNDRGRTWTVYEGNPVIKHNGRDPKLKWYEPGKHWVIAVFDLTDGDGISIYTSKDLKKWDFASKVDGFHECAELVEMPVDGNPSNKRWVMFGANAQYAVGRFDGRVFTPEHEGLHRVHYGNYYASQCFSNAPGGRVVQIGWTREFPIPGMPFNQAFSLPTALTLHTTADGIRMLACPIKELEQLRRPNPRTVSNKALAAAAPGVEIPAPGQLHDIEVTLRQGSATKAVLRFGENTVTYDFKQQRLDEMPLKMTDGTVTFRVVVDRPMYEVVGGKGSCYKTSARKDQGKPLGTLSLNAEGGDLTVVSLVAYEMKSIWKKQP